MLVCQPISLLPEITSHVSLCIRAQSLKTLQESRCAPAGKKPCTLDAVPPQTRNKLSNNKHQTGSQLGWGLLTLQPCDLKQVPMLLGLGFSICKMRED